MSESEVFSGDKREVKEYSIDFNSIDKRHDYFSSLFFSKIELDPDFVHILRRYEIL
jgi:hypothetical protein